LLTKKELRARIEEENCRQYNGSVIVDLAGDKRKFCFDSYVDVGNGEKRYVH
jgi:hypothetical protein